MRCLLSFLLVGLSGLGWMPTASAQEIMYNGGFETGNLTGWFFVGQPTVFINVVNNPALAHSGTII